MKQVAINLIVVTSIVAIGSCQNPEPDYPPPGGGEETGQGTDQGWDYGTAQAWYHIDQGTAFFPYEWFVALEQAGGQERFATPGHMQRFGFLSNPPHQAYNPDGLPIGFSRTELHLDKGAFQCWQGNWVGLTCAACHTGQVNYHGTSLLIEGGPAHNDIETFRANLAQAFAANASDPEKAQRFVGRILAQQPELSPADVQAGLQCFGQASMARARFEQEALAAADEPPSAAGPARLDALGRGGNSLFAESTGTIGNYKPTTAPVSFPALWDTPYFDWVLYNNSVRQPLARSVVEALGVGAPMDLSTLNAPELWHNVQMDNLVDTQLWLQELKSPKWPEPVLGDIDQDLADRGAEVYGVNCASCHQVIDRDAHDASCATRTEIVIPSYPIEAVGTDPRQGIAKAQGRDKEFLQQLTTDQSAILSNVLDLVRQYQRYPGVVVPTFTPMPDAYRLETYWSGKAHQLGIDGVPVKYIARPCNSNGIYVPTKAVDFAERTSDFLQVELKRHIEQPLDLEEPACFDFYLQPLKTEAMTDPDGEVLPEEQRWRWVEDTTLEWKELEAPAYRVGKITLTGPALTPEICDDPANFINSSINTLPEHEGLGRISRAEKAAAPGSIRRRTRE